LDRFPQLNRLLESFFDGRQIQNYRCSIFLCVRSESSTAKKKARNDVKIFADNAAKYQAEHEAAEKLVIVKRRSTKENFGFYVPLRSFIWR